MNMCPCYELKNQPLDSSWPAPRCSGVMSVWPSGNSACPCGQHVEVAR